MKITAIGAPLFLTTLLLACTLAVTGCANEDAFGTTHRMPIGPAPAGMPNSGIGAPGGASEDTRSIGSVAASEGEANEGAPSVGVGNSSVPVR